MVLGELNMQIYKKLDPYLSLYTKFNSEWLKYPNLRAETTKLLEENMGKHLKTLTQANISFG
jgi:hypothetical protein